MDIKNFPHEVFIQIENNDFFIGRITVYQTGKKFQVEVDIINDESKKIYLHVGNLYEQVSAEDGVKLGVQKLADYLARVGKKEKL